MTKFLNISTDTTLGGNSPSDETVSSQKALKTYIDANASGSPSWGSITGNLSNQTDLNTALTNKTDTDLSNITTTAQENLIDLLYPVGAVYIGTTSTCPLAAIKGTWTLQSSGIVTSVNSNVPVKGTGMSIGLTNDGSTGLTLNGGTNAFLQSFSVAYGQPVGTYSGTGSYVSNNTSLGVTKDETKSGIVGTVTSSTLSVNIFERTA